MTKTLEQEIDDIRDHAYRAAGDSGDERARPFIRLALPFIDALLLLARETKTKTDALYAYDVVDAFTMVHRTKNEGWQYVEAVVNDTAIQVTKQIQQPGQGYTVGVQEQEMGRTTFYVIRRPVDSPVQALLGTIATDRARADAAGEALKKAQKALEEAQASTRTALQQRDDGSAANTLLQNQMTAFKGHHEKLLEVADERVKGAQASVTVLETQLAKLTHALGAIKMKEILES